ncbi:hypothetical protein HWV62_13205, partial [Athelia sp. TMB]
MRLRSSTQATPKDPPTGAPISDTFITGTSPASSAHAPIQLLLPGHSLPHLPSPELKLLRKKQKRLASQSHSTHDSSTHAALAATLIFAQPDAGTAVCVHPHGWVLTCAHCFGESAAEWAANKRKWLLAHTGLA